MNLIKYILILQIFFPNFLYSDNKNSVYDPSFTYFTISAGPTAGTYFAYASSLASALTRPYGSPSCDKGGSCGVDNVIAIAYATEGSRQNIDQLLESKVNSAFVQTSDLVNKDKRIKVIATLFPEYLHAVVRGHSGLHNFADIKGKKISVGPQFSGSSKSAQSILNVLGLAKWEYTIAAHDLGQSCDALSNKDIDALLYFGGGPIPSIGKMARCEQIRFLSLTPKQQLRLTSRFSFLEATEIPSGLYWGVAKTPTVAMYAKWVTRADMPDEEIKKLTASFYHPKTQKFLKTHFPHLNLVSAEESFKQNGKDLHPGALLYYQEHHS